MEEGVGQTIACAAHGCDILVDDVTVMRLVKDSKVRLKYQHLITNSFVEVHHIKSLSIESCQLLLAGLSLISCLFCSATGF